MIRIPEEMFEIKVNFPRRSEEATKCNDVYVGI